MKNRALIVLAIIFFASFLGRFAVLASEITGAMPEPAPPSKPQHDPNAEYTCVDGALATAVKDRIAALDAREANIANRASELKAYGQQIETRLGELEQANMQLKANIETHQTARDNDIAKLAAIYEGMKPSQASEIINEMDPEFAAGLLASMNSEQAAQIVATIDSKRAYMISVLLANRTHTP